MSEIKGQILGIILVLAIFGSIAGVLMTLFNNTASNLESKLDVKAHGILSFDLKEDSHGELKVTEVNIRHMAYTGVMAQAGFDLIEDTIRIMEDGNADGIMRAPYYHYDKPYVFLRDVDIEPMLLESEEIFNEREY